MAPTIDQAAELLGRLVACPSVNPGRRRAAAPPFGEAAMADLLGGIVSAWGARTWKVELGPGRCNFLSEFPGDDPARSLLLEAHADTVAVEGMAGDPFAPVRRGGRLYGRGSCDAKGPMTAMLLAIRTVLQERGRPPATLHFVATGDEESGAGGAQRLVADGFRSDAAIIGEPTDLRIVHAHKGAYRCRIIAPGRAAHSSDPSLGSSAIARMARVVQALEGPLAERLAQRSHPLFGPPTVSVGTIRGGTQVNVVPDRCEIEVDRRTLPDEDRATIAREFRDALDALAATDPEFPCVLEESEWYPAFEEDPAGPIAQQVAAACRAVLGQAEFAAVPWAANAGIFRQGGIPCVLFGPGSIRQAHTADEFVELAEVVRAAEVYAEVIRRS